MVNDKRQATIYKQTTNVKQQKASNERMTKIIICFSVYMFACILSIVVCNLPL